MAMHIQYLCFNNHNSSDLSYNLYCFDSQIDFIVVLDNLFTNYNIFVCLYYFYYQKAY